MHAVVCGTHLRSAVSWETCRVVFPPSQDAWCTGYMACMQGSRASRVRNITQTINPLVIHDEFADPRQSDRHRGVLSRTWKVRRTGTLEKGSARSRTGKNGHARASRSRPEVFLVFRGTSKPLMAISWVAGSCRGRYMVFWELRFTGSTVSLQVTFFGGLTVGNCVPRIPEFCSSWNDEMITLPSPILAGLLSLVACDRMSRSSTYENRSVDRKYRYSFPHSLQGIRGCGNFRRRFDGREL